MRRLATLLGVVLLLPVLLLAGVLVGANTAPGRDAIARLAMSFVPGLTIEGLQGPLPGRPGVTRVTMADERGVWLELEDARIAWDPRALLRGALQVETIAARRVALHRLPEGEAPAEPSPPGPLIPQIPRLPLALRVDRLDVGAIEIGEAVAGVPLALRLAGSAALDAEGVTATLDAASLQGATSLALDATLRPATGRLTAHATLRGEAGGPLSRLAGLDERPLSLDLSLDGPAENAALALKASAGDGLGADIAGTVSAPDTSRYAARIEGRVDASGLLDATLAPLAGPLDVALEASRSADGLVTLRRLRVAGRAGTVEASGTLDAERDRNALTARLSLAPSATFGALVPDVAAWDAVEAEVRLTGRLDAPRLALDAAPTAFRSSSPQVAALLGASPRMTLRAALPDRLERAEVTGQALRAEAAGRVGDTLDVTFSADIAAPDRAVPNLSGALALRGTARGAMADPTLTLSLRSEKLEIPGLAVEALALDARIANPATRPDIEASGTGRLDDLPLDIAVRATPEADGWITLREALLRLGPAKLDATGRVDPAGLRAEGSAKLEVADLAPFARLAGRPLAGSIRLEARGELRDGVQAVNAVLDVPRLAAEGVTARDVKAHVEGTLDALDFTLSGTAQDVTAEARGRVTQQNGARRLDLAALRATGFNETVRLASPATVTLKPDGAVEIGMTTIALPRSGTLRAEGRWGPGTADIRATLSALDLAAFAALIPEAQPAGTITGEFRVTGPTASPEVTATLRGTGLRSGNPAARGLPAGELRLEAKRAGDGAVTAAMNLTIGPQQRLAATARFPRGPSAAAPFEATLDGNLDLGPLTSPLLAAGADRVTGRLVLGLRANGTPAAPNFGGDARLAQGSYRNAVTGVAVTDLSGTLRPDGPRLRLDLNGRTTGEGRLALAGSVEPLAPFLPVDIQLTATNAQPVSSDIVRATVDADLRLAGRVLQDARLAGTVRIRRAEIRVPEKLGGGTRTLEPVIQRGTPRNGATIIADPAPAAADPGAGPPVALAIAVEADRQVYVRGRGLDAELGGKLDIGGTVAAPQITGQLAMRRGDIAVVGRRLTFDRGRLDWHGGVIPDLDFRATSQAGQVSARVEVTGPATQPVIAFSSTPELPQDEILARLLFDRPLRDLSPLEIAQIAAAAAGATGLPGGDAATGFLDRLRQGFGLDRLAVGGNNESAGRNSTQEERAGATLEAGRYVADGVYVGVKQGTQPGSSSVGVRVDLTPRMRLEAETGDSSRGNRVGLNWEWQWGR
ncbi:translocation/assembly module TamB domain-containing protein [Falsiroseomonas sp. HW251]|uniref:translocation/assembly module TamB domain-containing protein n=1 Tax=Falsiroseomonas sp. HW251 TaxID=3390998 RepID=UPI003D322E61